MHETEPSQTEELHDAIRRLWREGDPVTTIGRKLGLTKGQVSGKVARLDLPKRKGVDTPRKPPGGGNQAREKARQVSQPRGPTLPPLPSAAAKPAKPMNRTQLGAWWWSQQDRIARLRQYWAEGDTGPVIAAKLKTTPNAVIAKVHREGLPGRPSPIKHVAVGERVKDRWRQVPAAGPVTLPPLRSDIEVRVPVVAAPPPPPALNRLCQWPMSDGKPWTFCDAPCSGTYCTDHTVRAKGKTPSAADRAFVAPPRWPAGA